MKLKTKNILVALAVALAVILPFMLFGGDLQTGNAAGGWAYYGHSLSQAELDAIIEEKESNKINQVTCTFYGFGCPR